MIVFPNAKINLGLFITELRPDGFHNIETVFLPVPTLCDILEVIPLTGDKPEVAFSSSGLPIDSDDESNLCVKAYRSLSERIKLPPVDMHLYKQIPLGAGLGGGSADGAFALRMLNSMAKNPLTDNQLGAIALELGSDCPFFLVNKPCLAKGRGELLLHVNPPLKGKHLLIVNPNISVSTGTAYSMCSPQPPPMNLKHAIEKPILQWRGEVYNDFEKIVFSIHSEISALKDELYTMGAIFAAMTGSGSTVYGIFDDEPDFEGRFEGMFRFKCKL